MRPLSRRAQRLVAVLRAVRIEVHLDEDVTAYPLDDPVTGIQGTAAAMTTTKGAGFEVRVAAHPSIPTTEVEASLEHEFWHIIRGDLRQRFMSRKEAIASMLAAEAYINHRAGGTAGAITYKTLQEGGIFSGFILRPMDDVSDIDLLGAVELEHAVFQHLIDGTDAAEGAGDGEQHELHPLSRIDPADFDKLVQAELESRLRLRGETDLEQLREEATNAGLVGPKTVASQTPPVLPAPEIEAVLRLIKKSLGGRRQLTRTWSREGHFPEVRGVAVMPRQNFAIFCDSSGSMLGEKVKIAAGISFWLQQRHSVATFTFDDQLHLWRPGQPLPGGGGTLCAAIVAQLRIGRYDGAVIITDGEIYDLPTAWPEWCPPTIWVIVGGDQYRLSTIRRTQDAVIVRQ